MVEHGGHDLDGERADENLRGAIDWAHSVQARLAEHLAGAMARDATDDSLNPVLRNELRTLAEHAGLDTDCLTQDFEPTDHAKLSEFDEPAARRVLQNSIDRLSNIIADAGMQMGGRKLLAWSLPSGEINALCAANTWDDCYYHIFIDPDLITFCNSIAKIFAECFAAGRSEDGEIGVVSSKIIAAARSLPIAARAVDLFNSAVLHGTPRASKPWLPSKEAFGLNLLIGQSIKDFVVAHELSHLIQGHLEADDTQSMGIADVENLNSIVYSKKAEFEADAVAAILSTQAAIAGTYSNIFTCLAPYIFLRSVETLDFCTSVFDQPSTGLSFTHPSARERADRIREVIRLHAAYHNSGKLLTEAIRRVDQIGYWLSAAATAHLRERKAAGVLPRARLKLRAVERGDPSDIFRFRPTAVREPRSADILDIAAKFANRDGS